MKKDIRENLQPLFDNFVKDKDIEDHYVNVISELFNLKMKKIPEKLEKSLGHPVAGNSYVILPDASGKFWIEHDKVCSGEMLKDWIEKEIKKLSDE